MPTTFPSASVPTATDASLLATSVALQDGQDAVQAADEAVEPWVRFAIAALVVFALGWFVVRPALLRSFAARNRNNRTIQVALRRWVSALVVLAAVYAGFVAAGYADRLGRSGLVIAAATLALGVAGQAVIGNVVSGFFLVADPKFNVGDWIRWDDREGVVEDVGLRVTRVRSPDNETLTVPNTELTTTTVSNPYGGRRYRLTETVGVSYDDDLQTAREVLRTAAGDVDDVLPAPSPAVTFVGFEERVLLQVRMWIAEPRRETVARARFAFADRALTRARAAGVTLDPPVDARVGGRLDVGSELGDDAGVPRGDLDELRDRRDDR